MSAPAWMPLYIGTFFAETAALSAEETGAFSLLLMHRFMRGSVPDTDERCAIVCRMTTSRWRAIKDAVLPLFEIRAWGRSSADAVLGLDEKPRPGLSPSLRAAVFRRDGEKCQYCGNMEGPFEVDHVHPWSRGGKHEIDNLAVACVPCNRSKGALRPEEWKQ